VNEKIADLGRRIGAGGLNEASIRGMLYVNLPRAAADERSFAVLRRLRRATPESRQMPLATFKQLVRDQFFMLLLDPAAALAAIPSMLPDDPEAREAALRLIREVVEARGEMEPEVARRFAEISRLFDAAAPAGPARGHDAPEVSETSRHRRSAQAR